VLFALDFEDGLLPDTLAQALVLVVALSMAATPALAAAGRRLAAYLDRADTGNLADIAIESEKLAGHTIVAGFGRVGQTVVKFLADQDVPYVAIDNDAGRVAAARLRGFNVYFGDGSRGPVLAAAGAARARSVVIAIGPMASERVVAMLRRLYPRLTILARARDRVHVDELARLGADHAVPETLEGSIHLGAEVLSAAGIPRERAQALAEDFRRDNYARLGELIQVTSRETGSGR
jgi:CPA2 family monovalent cation:H+ antiporter-2